MRSRLAITLSAATLVVAAAAAAPAERGAHARAEDGQTTFACDDCRGLAMSFTVGEDDNFDLTEIQHDGFGDEIAFFGIWSEDAERDVAATVGMLNLPYDLPAISLKPGNAGLRDTDTAVALAPGRYRLVALAGADVTQRTQDDPEQPPAPPELAPAGHREVTIPVMASDTTEAGLPGGFTLSWNPNEDQRAGDSVVDGDGNDDGSVDEQYAVSMTAAWVAADGEPIAPPTGSIETCAVERNDECPDVETESWSFGSSGSLTDFGGVTAAPATLGDGAIATFEATDGVLGTGDLLSFGTVYPLTVADEGVVTANSTVGLSSTSTGYLLRWGA